MMDVLLLRPILLFRLMMGGRFLQVGLDCYLMVVSLILRGFIDLRYTDL